MNQDIFLQNNQQQQIIPSQAIQQNKGESNNIQKRLRQANLQLKQCKHPRLIPQEDASNLEIEGKFQSILYKCGELSGCLGQWCPCCQFPYQTIQKSYKGIFERFGKYVKTVDDGYHFVNSCTDSLIIIDIKTQNIDLSKQWAITMDNIMISIDGVVQYRISDCKQAHYSINNIQSAVCEIALSSLRSIVGHFTFQQLLDHRMEMQQQVEDFVYMHVQEWGIEIEQIVIKDIAMETGLSSQLEVATKERRLAQAKILNAKVDVESAKQQRIAADYMDSKTAMQIRYLSTLEKISSKSKIVYLSDQ